VSSIVNIVAHCECNKVIVTVGYHHR